jgi:hypothetical protein
LRSESIRDKGTIRDLGSREYILKIEPAGVSTLNGERERERERERDQARIAAKIFLEQLEE